MTADPTRLAEIAAKFQTDDWLGTEAGEAINYLIGTLTAAQARSREDAEIMTQMSDDITSLVWHVKFLCRLYNDGDLPIGFDSIDARHTARQVARADELEGRTDG